MYGSGQMKEEIRRSSIGYALFNYLPLALIADVSKHAGGTPNLWAYTTPSGKSLLKPAEYYAPYLAGRSGPDWSPQEASEARAQMELVYTNYPSSTRLRDALNTGGDSTRGGNYDGRCCGYGALVGELSSPNAVAPPPPGGPAAAPRPTPVPRAARSGAFARIFLPPFLSDIPEPTPAPSANVAAIARTGVRWGGRTFTSAVALRRHLERRGQSWERFLRLHPAVTAAFQLRSVDYGEVFYTKRGLTRWLSRRGLSYRAWAALHPTAASILEAQSRGRPALLPTPLKHPASIPVKRPVVRWHGKAFTSPAALRAHLRRRGVDWDVFIRRHPGVAAVFRLPVGPKPYDS